MKNRFLLRTTILVGLILSACAPSEPAVTATPSFTPSPELTSTPTATFTPSPTPTQIPPSLQGTPLPPMDVISPENAEQVVEVARWGTGVFRGIQWLPGGHRLLRISTTYVSSVDLDTLETETQIEINVDNLRAVAVSPDGKTMATTNTWMRGLELVTYGENSSVDLWDLFTGKEILNFKIEKKHEIFSLVFSPDGQTLAMGSGDKSVQIMRVADGSIIHTMRGHEDGIIALAFSPDGSTLASGGLDGTILVWNTIDGTLVRKLHGDKFSVFDLDFSPDGQILASASGGGIIWLWNVADGSVIHKIDGKGGTLLSVSFSPDGQYIASGYFDGKVRLWRTKGGAPVYILDGGNAPARVVTFSDDGQLLAVLNSYNDSGKETLIHVWKVSDGSLLQDWEEAGVKSIVSSPDGSTLAFSLDNGEVRVYQLGNGSLLKTLEMGKTEDWRGRIMIVMAGNALAFSPSGDELAVGSAYGLFQRWRTKDWVLLTSYTWREGPGSNIRTIKYSADGKFIGIAGPNGLIVAPFSCPLPCERGYHKYGRFVVAFSPDGKQFAYGGVDNAGTWDLSDDVYYVWLDNIENIFSPPEEGPGFQTGRGKIIDLEFSPDSQILAAATAYGKVVLFDVTNNTQVKQLNFDAAILSLAFSPDGKILAIGSADGFVRLYLIKSDAIVELQTKAMDWVTAVVFSPDGRFLISSSHDGTIRFWGVR